MKLLVLLAILPVFIESDILYYTPYGALGPDTPSAVFQGRITQNGKPVPAQISLEVMYKNNGDLIPLSLVQVDSPSNYDIHVSGLAFKNENITNDALLRVQSLSVNGGSKLVRFRLKDKKMFYKQDIELEDSSDNDEDYVVQEVRPRRGGGRIVHNFHHDLQNKLAQRDRQLIQFLHRIERPIFNH